MLLALACFPFVAARAQRDRSCISFRAASFCEEPLVHIAVISSTAACWSFSALGGSFEGGSHGLLPDAMKLFDERK